MTLDLAIATKLWEKVPNLEALCEQAYELALEGAGFSKICETSLLLTDNFQVKELNASYRDQDRPTNVLSFPQYEPDDLSQAPEPLLLGDLIMADQVCIQEADVMQIPLAAHIQHLVIHGTLHLLGYDHETDEEAAEMESLETKLVKQLGWDDPYV